MNLDDLFRDTARRQPDRPAIFDAGRDAVLTYRELDEAVGAASRRMRRAGVRAGDCVALHDRSGSTYIVLTYAVWRCGGCVVPVPFELAAAEKRAICREIAVDFVVSPANAADFAECFRRGDTMRVFDATEDIAIVPIRSPREHPAGYDPRSAAFIRFTSGTTGASKGVVLSHQTIRDRIGAANEALEIGPTDRVLWLLSMSYHFTVSIVAYLTFGASIVLPANHFAAAILTAAEQFRATLVYGSSVHCSLLADYPSASPMPAVRRMISTTYSLGAEVARTFHRRYELPVTQALGIIEVGLPCINIDFAAEKGDSVGKALPAYELRLDDLGMGPELGEVLLRGKGMLDAYYAPWRPRGQILVDGWFRTGDIGQLDSDGCLFLRGRCKDVISVMGMKFFPQEVEAVLAAHPSVEAACVFADRHPRFGEAPHARVVVRPGLNEEKVKNELRQWCAERLAEYKVPESVEIIDVLPRTASGKILHRHTAGGPE